MNSRTENRIKIIFFDHAPFMGGAEIAILRHIRYLNKDKFEPYLISSKESIEFVKQATDLLGGNVKFISFKRLKPISFNSILKFIQSVFESIRICLKIKPDYIVANVERAFYVSFITSVIMRVKLILFIRDFEFSHKLLKFTDWKVTKYLPVSNNIAEYYHLKNKTQIVYVGSDIRNKSNLINLNDIMEIKNRYKILGTDFVIGSTSRIYREKGPFMLLEAFNQIIRSNPDLINNLKLIFVGEGPDLKELKDKISGYSLLTNVILAGFSTQIHIWYKIFKVFVHASVYNEPFATTVIEAALSKCPIVATDTGGTSEFIEDNQTGLLIKPNCSDITQALLTLYRDPKLANILAENAYQKAIKFNTEEKITSELEQIYLNC